MSPRTLAEQCTLLVGGTEYGGWTRVEAQRSIEQIAGGFILELTQRWPGVDTLQGLSEGASCELRFGPDTVIKGYIDTFEPELTDGMCKVRVEGRDATGDLVDCSVLHPTGQWAKAKLETIVADICKPFGIAVRADVNTGEAFAKFAIEGGERAFDAIDRACKLRAVLPMATANGGLLLTRASEVSTGVLLEEGVNIKAIRSIHSWRERHSQIIIKAQSAGDDDVNGAAAAQQKASARDEEIDRYRPLIVVAESESSSASLGDRARWELLVRMGRGKRGRCTVVGWRTGLDGQDGPLWTPNTLVTVRSARMNLDREVLIVGCAYTLSEQGTTTELSFALPDAFELIEGIGRSRLNARLNDKTAREKRQRDDGFTPSWERWPNRPRDPRDVRQP